MSITHRAPDTLRAHPLNEQLYDSERDADELAASVAAHGVLTALTVDQDGTILSGHRRWQAARAAGLATVPVVVRPVSDPLEAEHLLLESNRQREKSYTERMREAEHIERIVAARAKGRQGERTDLRATLHEGSGRTDQEVAEAVGLKQRTYAKVRRVYHAAHDAATPEPLRVLAQQQMAALDAGETTPNAAEKALREAEARTEVQALMDTIAASAFTDPPATQAAAERLMALIPTLPQDDLVTVHDFATGVQLHSYSVKAHLVAAHVRQHKAGLAAAAQEFGITRPVVAGLLIMHEEAQGGIRFHPTGLQIDEGFPRERYIALLDTLTALDEMRDEEEDEQLLDRCRALVRQLAQQPAAA